MSFYFLHTIFFRELLHWHLFRRKGRGFDGLEWGHVSLRNFGHDGEHVVVAFGVALHPRPDDSGHVVPHDNAAFVVRRESPHHPELVV